MVEAMIYILRVGCPWRDLPDEFGPWNSVYTRWWRWNRNGIWALMLELLAREQEGSLVHLDATHVKVHQDASRIGGEQSDSAIGRTKGGLNTKVTALVDSRGQVAEPDRCVRRGPRISRCSISEATLSPE